MKLDRKIMKAGGALAAVALSVTALATLPSGFTPSGIARIQLGELDARVHRTKATGDWDLMLKTRDDTTINVDRLSIDPGGFSGWHAHPGPVFARVTVGSILWFDGSDPECGFIELQAGDSFYEPAYNPHYVLNASEDDPAEYVAVAIAPSNAFAQGGIGFRLNRDTPEGCPE